MRAFASRVTKEIIRDPLNLFFGLGFPVVLLLLLSAIQANIPVSLFEIDSLAPGIAVFGLSFITLFSATLISKDRSTSLMPRLCTTPLTPTGFILGYTFPLIPISIAQSIVCFAIAVILGLDVTVNIVYGVIGVVPIALFYISFGLLCGSILSDKQVGGVCGALLTNLSAWLSGIWFDLELVGGAFKKAAYCLPFAHAVEMERSLIAGDFYGMVPHLIWVTAYALGITVLAVLVFLRKMKNQ